MIYIHSEVTVTYFEKEGDKQIKFTFTRELDVEYKDFDGDAHLAALRQEVADKIDAGRYLDAERNRLTSATVLGIEPQIRTMSSNNFIAGLPEFAESLPLAVGA
jgi:hypothetical protein